MLNQCTFIGRLTKEVEVQSPNGKSFANFSLAIQRDLPDQNGDRQTDFLDFKVLGKAAENMAKQLSKGDLIAVTSRAQKRSYKKDGKNVYVTEFIVEGYPKFIRVKKWESGSSGDESNGASNSENPFTNYQDIPDEDLPF